MRVRRTATRENSVATKNPLARTRATTARSASGVLIGGFLTVAGATGPGTTGDRGPMRPGSPDHFSATSGGDRYFSASSSVVEGREEHDQQASHQGRGPQADREGDREMLPERDEGKAHGTDADAGDDRHDRSP